MLVLVRAARFALWCLALRLRLRRHGVRLVLDVAAPPRFRTLPHVEVRSPAADAPRGGTLTLRLGRAVQLGRDLVLEVGAGGDAALAVGDGAIFESFCRVQLDGGRVVLGPHVHVRDLCLLKSKSALEVGARTVLSRAVNVHATAGVTIGEHGAIGERSSLIDSDHAADGSAVPVLEQPLRVAPIVLGRNVMLGANAVVLRGARIGDNAVVAANAVVTAGEHPGGWVLAGAPAEPRRALSQGGERSPAQ